MKAREMRALLQILNGSSFKIDFGDFEPLHVNSPLGYTFLLIRLTVDTLEVVEFLRRNHSLRSGMGVGIVDITYCP